MPPTESTSPTSRQAVAGYRPGLAQPAQTISLELTAPDPGALPRLEAWMSEALALDVATLPAPVVAAQGQAPAELTGLAARILQIAAELLRLVRIPVFDPGRIVAAAPLPAQPGRWRIGAAVARIDHVPEQAWSIAYRAALQLADRMQRAAPSPEGCAEVHRFVESSVIAPLKSIRGGVSTIPILRTAFERGVPFRHLGAGVYQLGWGRSAQRVERGAFGTDSALGASLSHDKARTAIVLAAAGLPTPRHRVVGDKAAALDAARELGWPVVVKPVDRDRGEGVAVNLASEDAVRAAFATAFGLSRRVLVERQVDGVCHRLHVAAGKVLIVTKRRPKSVRGDGRSTVAELIARANEEEARKPPWQRLKPWPEDALAIESLRAAGLSLDSVPEPDGWAPLRPIQRDAWGGVVEPFTDTVHPENVELALRAAAAVGLSCAGVDIISVDIRQPWYENGAIVNEVNFSPNTSPGPDTRHLLADLIDCFLPDRGRVPIEVFVGGRGALERAKARQTEFLARDVASYLASPGLLLSPEVAPVRLATANLFEDCVALLMRADLGALVIACPPDAWRATGLPVDRFDRTTIVDRDQSDPTERT